MTSRAMVSYLLEFFSKDVWAVYGIQADDRRACRGNLNTAQPSETRTDHSRLVRPSTTTHLSLPTQYSPVQEPGPFTPQLSILIRRHDTQSSTKQPRSLSPETKTGIGVAVAVALVALGVAVIFGSCYFRRRSRQRGILNAIEQVERGAGGGRRDSRDKGSQERIVLESRVSIVFDDDGRDEEDGDGVDGFDGGRNGMSLPRRAHIRG